LWGPDGYGNAVRRHGVQVRSQEDIVAVGWQPNPGGWS
jgi:pilus assembly protein CpaF